MLEYGRGLFSRIVDALGIDQRSAPPAYAVVALERVSEGQELREEAVALFELLSEPLGLLNSACQDAGIAPRTQHKASKRLEIYREPVVALLKADRKAAMTVSSLIIQYQEALAELKKLDAALEAGDMERLNIEKAKGKFFYLTRMRFALESWPTLVQIFAPPPSDRPGAAAPTRAAPGPVAAHAATPRGGLSGSPRGGVSGAPRQAPRPPGTGDLGASVRGTVSGIRQSMTNALGPPPGPTQSFDSLVEEGLRLVQSLQMKILILQSAAEKAQGKQPQTEGLLPPPARQTADTMGAALVQDRNALKLVDNAVQKYRNVCMMLHRGDPAEHNKLRAALTELGTLPLQLGDHAVLAKLFPAA